MIKGKKAFTELLHLCLDKVYLVITHHGLVELS